MVKIITFVDKSDIDPLLHDANYIAVPDKNTDAYAIMLRALEKSKKAGVGTVTIRQKQHPAIVYAHDGGIVVTTLCHDDEVIHPKNLAAVREIPTPKKEMVDLAVEIVENLTGEFKLGDIKDESRVKMEAMIAAKKAGKKIIASDIPTTVNAPVDNLMETLKAAAKATKKKGK
jgi:DNA end-binding protein Ku